MKNTYLIVLTAIFVTNCYGNLPEDPQEYAKWESGMLSAVSNQANQPKEQAIQNLGTWVMQLSQQGTPNWETGGRSVFHAAQAALLAIPGHAEYYRDQINGARERMEAALNPGNDADYATARHALSDEVMYGFRTLEQLPSVETVRVLGECLSDERGYVKVTLDNPNEKQRYQSVKHSPVYRKAALALAALPIVGKPGTPRMEFGGPEDTAAWKQWYEEIKDGKRTFRFEGDPVEYDLNGPAPGQKLTRISRDRKRDAERAAGYAKTAAPP